MRYGMTLEALATSLGNAAGTPADIRRRGNRLAAETSLYLRQHGHNPLDWYPWGDPALSRARTEGRPIFLSIGYASCHWCHVMEAEVFDVDEVAEFLNGRFICIKVDREERPDLDAAYMEAVQAISGGGGWPMSVFLTPDGKPFFGGTYYPRGPFLALARKIDELFRTHRDRLESEAAALAEALAAGPGPAPGAAIDATAIGSVAAAALARHDTQWGGFAGAMKFPMPVAWRFLLRHFRRTGDQRFARSVRTTLDRMASGGIHDQVGGGFHRYTVEPTWLVPHFEKMLYDSAQIAGLYAEAFAVFGERRYAEVARDTLEFLLREMRGPEGEFFASFDADSGGEEGSYYVWTPADLRAAVGDEDGPVLAALLGVTEEGNFEGRSIPTRRVPPGEVAGTFGRDEDDVATLPDRHREALRAFRDRRDRPALDRKVVTAWNALAISAFAQASRALDEPRYRAAAVAAAEYLLRVHRREDGRFARASNGGVPVGEGVLDDTAGLAVACFDLFEATGDFAWAERALALVADVRARFGGPDGSYYLTADDVWTPLGRKVEVTDGVQPSGIASLLSAMLTAATLTGREEFVEAVDETLGARAGLIRAHGPELAGWLDAAARRCGAAVLVVIAGDENDPGTRTLRHEADRLPPPDAVVARVSASGPTPEQARLAPGTIGKTALGERATAFVCRHGTCYAPTSDPKDLRAQILEARGEQAKP